MTASWPRHDDPARAVARILEGAEKAFVEVGVSRASMAKIAELAGCSRGTLYHHFATRHALHVAYIDHKAREIVERVGETLVGLEDPCERLVEGVLGAVRAVREQPATAAWFEPGASGTAARMSRSSEVVATTFVGGLLGPGRGGREARLRARWLWRVIVSLLATPGESVAEERALVETFVAPVLLSVPRR